MAKRHSSRQAARRRSAAARHPRAAKLFGRSLYYRSLRCEPLEDRRLLAVVTVDTLDDSVDINDGLLSLREAIFATNTVPGPDTIQFAPALTAGGPATILLEHGELSISDDLSIEGPGAELLTIDASGNDETPDEVDGMGSRVFSLSNPNGSFIQVSIGGLAITGGDVDGHGGGLHSSSTVTLSLDDIDIYGNAATESGGGAYIINSPTTAVGGMNITNVDVYGNRAFDGGGMYVATHRFSNTHITNSSFEGNEAERRGGGLFLVSGYSSGLVSVTISSSQFSGNRAQAGGGAHLDVGSDSTVLLDGVIVSLNESIQSGGGMQASVNGGTLSFSGGEFTQNNSGLYSGGIDLRWVANGAIDLFGVVISNNTAVRRGGGVGITRSLNSPINPVSLLSIRNVTIHNNRTEEVGGGISFIGADGGGRLEIVDSTISNNSAAGNGGGIHIRNRDRSNFSAEADAISVRDSVISGNTADGNGGGIFAELYIAQQNGRVDFKIERSMLLQNEATSGGGLFADLEIERRASGALAFVVDSSTISRNTSSDAGGVFLRAQSAGPALTPRINNSTISLNIASSLGGGLVTHQFGAGVIELNHSTVGLNEGAFLGGGVFVASGTLSMSHTIVGANTASAGRDLAAVVGTSLVPRFSLIGSQDGNGLVEAPDESPDANGNIIGGPIGGYINPRLGPLADNGGPTLTHQLHRFSPALNEGDPAAVPGQDGVPEFDQRGAPFKRILEGRIDIGAVELLLVDALPGDYNHNGIVDSADYTVWRDEMTAGFALYADGNGDGTVDDLDFILWRDNFGNKLHDSLGAAGSASTATEAAPLPAQATEYESTDALTGAAADAAIAVVVDTLLDVVDFTDGLLSLREAIFATNTVPGPDTIQFAPALTAGGPATILLEHGELLITDVLTIEGPGAELLTIDASGNDETPGEINRDGSRVFNLNFRDASDPESLVSEATITGLRLTGGDVNGSGGAILARNDLLILDGVVVDANSARISGGGVSFGGQEIRVYDSVISGNTVVHSSAARGGGIHAYGNDSTLIIERSIISHNVAAVESSGSVSGGGGIFAVTTIIVDSVIAGNVADFGGGINAADADILGSTINGNSAESGGGLTLRRESTISNSTISGNSASIRAAGIWMGQTAASLTVMHSTITDNTTPGSGGGIWADFNSLHIVHSIVSGNSGQTLMTGLSGDIIQNTSDFYSFSGFDNDLTVEHSLIGDGSGAFLEETPSAIPDANGNLIGGPINGAIDPLLGPLADNGGFLLPGGSTILTHSLLPGSPAINAGDLNAVAGQDDVPEFDQRGEPFGRIVGNRIDIGAFEYQTPTDLNLLVDTLADESDGDYSRGDLSLREAIELANAANYEGVADTIRFDPALTAGGPATILLEHGELLITDDLTIEGPGAELLTIDASGTDPTPDRLDGAGSRIFNIDDGDEDAMISVNLSGLRLTGVEFGDSGGAVLSREQLWIRDSHIVGNTLFILHPEVFPSGGAGVYSTGSLRLSDSLISNNRMAIGLQRGIGVYSEGAELIVERCTISENAGDTSARGGGIYSDALVTTISDSTISNNQAANGGGIYCRSEQFTVTNSFILNNGRPFGGGFGGGIYSGAESVLISHSTIADNRSSGLGGGIYTRTAMTIVDSTIADNTADSGGGVAGIFDAELTIIRTTIQANKASDDDGRGGGIFIASSFVEHGLTLADSSVIDNTAGGTGGGIYTEVGATITGSTISSNFSGSHGGGVFVQSDESVLVSIAHSTIANNMAGESPNSDGAGGGIYRESGLLSLNHALVVGNQDDGLAPDVAGVFSSNYSLIGLGANYLGPLTDNGGPTLTHALLPNSPAINAGDPALQLGDEGVPLHDQRGVPFTRVYGGRIDIGAFETQPTGLLLGDYNANGIVDAADYTVWHDEMMTGIPLYADGNGDGTVDDADFQVWRSNFGATLNNLPALSVAATFASAATPTDVGETPEPATLSQTEPPTSAAIAAELSSGRPIARRADRAMAPRADFDMADFDRAARQDRLLGAWAAATLPRGDSLETRGESLFDPVGDCEAADRTAQTIDVVFSRLGDSRQTVRRFHR